MLYLGGIFGMGLSLRKPLIALVQMHDPSLGASGYGLGFSSQSGFGAPGGGSLVAAADSFQEVDAVEAYFECITSCSLDDGECVTTCTAILREEGEG